MDCKLTKAEINHLRRLLGWVRCGIPQTPDDLMDTVRRIAPAVKMENGEPTELAKNALVKMHRESASVPKYIRAAIKALNKAIEEHEGEIVDAKIVDIPRSLLANRDCEKF